MKWTYYGNNEALPPWTVPLLAEGYRSTITCFAENEAGERIGVLGPHGASVGFVFQGDRFVVFFNLASESFARGRGVDLRGRGDLIVNHVYGPEPLTGERKNDFLRCVARCDVFNELLGRGNIEARPAIREIVVHPVSYTKLGRMPVDRPLDAEIANGASPQIT